MTYIIEPNWFQMLGLLYIVWKRRKWIDLPSDSLMHVVQENNEEIQRN